MLYPGRRRSRAAERGRQQDRRRDGDHPGAPRAARRRRPRPQPEITIKPRFDLAADLGVTTAALSQTIRIATLGDIDQNSAKFSLADRQVPITVSLSENARRDLVNARESAGADVERRLGAAEVGRRDRLRLGPDDRSSAPTRSAAPRSAPTSRRGWSAATRGRRSTSCRRSRTCRRASSKLNLGDQKWQAELIYYFAHRADVGRAAGVRGAGAALPPVPGAVRQHGLAAAGAAGRGDRACMSPASRCRCRC